MSMTNRDRAPAFGTALSSLRDGAAARLHPDGLQSTGAEETALDRLMRHLSPEAEAERVRRHEQLMAELKAAREELGRIIGVGSKE